MSGPRRTQAAYIAELQRFLGAALRAQYTVERFIGAGGMAVVFAGQDLERRRRVAIKVLNPEVASEVATARFVREIVWSSSFQHPHIVPVLGSGEASGVPYLVMPLVEGESLAHRLAAEPKLPLATALRYATNVASALDYAHRKGIVHRDIKPENILISDDYALVADFGIARALGLASGNTLTGAGRAIGSLAYMSPEQAAGDPEVDGRSDIYSLGCVLYEMLAGRRAFDGNTIGQIIHQQLQGAAPPMEGFREDVPYAVTEAIVRAMRREPEERFLTAREFGDALGGISADRVERVPSAETTTVPPRGRTGLWLLIAAIAAVAVLIATLLFGA